MLLRKSADCMLVMFHLNILYVIMELQLYDLPSNMKPESGVLSDSAVKINIELIWLM